VKPNRETLFVRLAQALEVTVLGVLAVSAWVALQALFYVLTP